MISAIHQATSTTQFYLYGRKHCTRTGWEAHVKKYTTPDILQDGSLKLSDKVYMITGANAGIGREITNFVASQMATVYMVCRTPERAEKALQEIKAKTKNPNVYLLLGDCGVESDVRRVWTEFVNHRKQHLAADSKPQEVTLDGLVCNAGALRSELTLTSEGIEETFATHLLFGTYLLGTLALPTLAATPESRLIVMSSGGMYNTKFPSWDDATSISCTGAPGSLPYSGQMVYAYAKRGQVLLCEEWAKEYQGKVKIASAHPGWTGTEGVDTVYGEKKKYLEPLRSTWEGAEGIIHLLVRPDVDAIQDGGFYLDRWPQRKHLPGVLYGDNTFTKNTPEEVQEMMTNLAQWSSVETRSSVRGLYEAKARTQPLIAMNRRIEVNDMMTNWHVLAVVPTIFEVGACNSMERYTWNDEKKCINAVFEFIKKDTTELSYFKQHAVVQNPPVNTHWGINPRVAGVYWPLGLSYLILDMAEDKSYVTVGVPDRSYMWIMTRDLPSEFRDTGVNILSAYEGLLLDSDDGTCTATSSTAEGTGKGKDTNSGSQEKSAPVCETSSQQHQTASSSASGVERVEAADPVAKVLTSSTSDDDATQAQKRESERSVLRRALPHAQALGYDISRIQRMAWNYSLMKNEGGSKGEGSGDSK